MTAIFPTLLHCCSHIYAAGDVIGFPVSLHFHGTGPCRVCHLLVLKYKQRVASLLPRDLHHSGNIAAGEPKSPARKRKIDYIVGRALLCQQRGGQSWGHSRLAPNISRRADKKLVGSASSAKTPPNSCIIGMMVLDNGFNHRTNSSSKF